MLIFIFTAKICFMYWWCHFRFVDFPREDFRSFYRISRNILFDGIKVRKYPKNAFKYEKNYYKSIWAARIACALGELWILVYCYPIVLSSWKYKPTLKASKKILSKLQSGSAINVLYRLGFPAYFRLQLFYTHLKVMRRRLKR